MRSIGLRLPILAMIILASSFRAHPGTGVLYLETADWIPTASVLALPTSYVVAGAYVVPTSYVVPTVYATAYLTESALVAPTTYLTPTYYETRFRRRGLFGRRLVETTRAYYIPTTAYYPTTYYYPTTFFATFYSPTVRRYCRRLHRVHDGPLQRLLWRRDDRRRRARGSNCVHPSNAGCHHSGPTIHAARTSPIQSEPAEDESIPSNVPELPAREAAPGRMRRVRPAGAV